MTDLNAICTRALDGALDRLADYEASTTLGGYQVPPARKELDALLAELKRAIKEARAAVLLINRQRARAEAAESELERLRQQNQQLREALRQCVDDAFTEIVGYTDCSGCKATYAETGEWWDPEASRHVQHEEDCPYYTFQFAALALADEGT